MIPQQQKPCPECGQIHEELLDSLADFASTMAEEFTERAFPEIWKNTKRDIKAMGRRDAAQMMFYTGATQMLAAFMHTMHEFPQEQ